MRQLDERLSQLRNHNVTNENDNVNLNNCEFFSSVNSWSLACNCIIFIYNYIIKTLEMNYPKQYKMSVYSNI